MCSEAGQWKYRNCGLLKVGVPVHAEKNLSKGLRDLEVQELQVDWLPDLGLGVEFEAWEKRELFFWASRKSFMD